MPLSKEEKQKILAEPFRIWPMPASGDMKDYGAQPHQLPVFEIKHSHPISIDLVQGGARCFRKGTEVIKYDGTFIKVEDIQIGDLLMGPDSKPRTVDEICTGTEEMYEVIPNKKHWNSFFCNESHILSLELSAKKSKRYKQNIVNISIKDYLVWAQHKKKAYSLYKSPPIEFEIQSEKLSVDPYFLGVWLGDLNEHIPHTYKVATREERLLLLAGLIDKAGRYRGSNFEITQKNKQLAQDISFLARSLGFAAHFKKREGVYYTNTICGDIHLIPVKIPQKKAVKNSDRFNKLHTFFTLKKLEPEKFYGFSLKEEDHRFLLADFTVCHNSGKSKAAAARALWFMTRFPKVEIVIGAKDMPLIDRTIKKDIKHLLTIHNDWDHPLVDKFPTDKRQTLRLINGSVASFIHFSEFEKLRGVEANYIHIEEASLLPSADVIEELQRRLSGTKAPIRQLLLTTNPEEQLGWVYDTFMLKQFREDYTGPPLPIGKPCKCQFCQECLKKNIEQPYVDLVCPRCQSRKTTSCQGNQEFFRVIFMNPDQNKHLPQDYYQSVKSGVSEEKFSLYTEGKIIELRQGFIYKNFSRNNIYPEPGIPVDYSKDIYWYHDFNISYMCSVLCQMRQTPAGNHVDVVDEIVIIEQGPEQVATEFLDRYPDYEETIYMDGDPSALNDKVRRNDISQFQIIYNILTDPASAGPKYAHIKPKKIVVLAKKVKGNTKIAVIPRVDSTNQLLKNPEGLRRLMINPKCEWLIRSLEAMRWKDGLDSVMDVQCDKNAMNATNKKNLRLISHPTDALGYFTYKNFPVVKQQGTPLFASIPGEISFEISSKGEYKETIHPDMLKKKKEDPYKPVPIEHPKLISIQEYLDIQIGEDQDGSFIDLGFYW